MTKRRFIYGGLTIVLLLLAALGFLWLYGPKMVKQRLPSGLSSVDVDISFASKEVELKGLLWRAQEGCKKPWFTAKKARVTLANWRGKLRSVRLDNPLFRFAKHGPSGEFCLPQLKKRRRKGSERFSIRFDQGAVVSPDAEIALAQVNLRGQIEQGKATRVRLLHIDGVDNLGGKFSLQADWKGIEKDSVDMSYFWPNIAKLPASWLRRFPYRFTRGALQVTSKLNRRKDGFLLRHRIILSKYSAVKRAMPAKLKNLFSAEQVDFLDIIKSKNGVVELNVAIAFAKGEDANKLAAKHRYAVRQEVKRQVEGKINRFLFWKK